MLYNSLITETDEFMTVVYKIMHTHTHTPVNYNLVLTKCYLNLTLDSS